MTDFPIFVSPVSRAEILGNSEVFIKSGNDINLTCVALEAPSPPAFIYWYKAGSIINYSTRGGISVLTERPSKTSKLVISRAMSSDSGNYTCSPSNSGAKWNVFSFDQRWLRRRCVLWCKQTCLWLWKAGNRIESETRKCITGVIKITRTLVSWLLACIVSRFSC